jgi:hypothetical protein
MAIFTLPIARVGDSNFRVGSGFKLYFYDAGTTDARDTYTSNTYATPLSNPVIADASGYFPVIWTTGDYKVRLTTAADVLVWEADNYTNDFGSTLFAEGVLSAPSSAANVIVANLPTTPGELIDQLQVVVELQHGANTITNPTFNLNDLGAKTIKRTNNTALIVGDTGGSGAKIYLSYSATNDVWILLNPVYAPLRTYAEYPMGLNWVSGLEVSNNTGDAEHDIDIAAGEIMDSTNTVRMTLGAAITKRIDAVFAVGTNQGGRSDQDSLDNGTLYYPYVIAKANGTTDVILATSQTNALADTVAAAAGFIYARRRRFLKTDGSANILPFWVNTNDDIIFDVPINMSISVSLAGATVSTGMPPNLIGIFKYNITGQRVAGDTFIVYGLLTETRQTNTNPVSSSGDIYGYMDVEGATSVKGSFGVIKRVRISASAALIRHRENEITGTVSNANLALIGVQDALTVL